MGRATLVIASLLLSAVAVGCATTSATSGSRPGSLTAGSQPPSDGATSTTPGTYVPASGTDPKSGLLFDTYTNATLGYRLLYPGGWNVTRKGTTVRIAKFGNAIVIAERPAKSAPKLKGVKAGAQEAEGEGRPAGRRGARETGVAVGRPCGASRLYPGSRRERNQSRGDPASTGTSSTTTARWWCSRTGAAAVHNRLAYKLIAETFAWA